MNRILNGIPSIQVDFYELYGGYYLTQLLKGPKLRPILFSSERILSTTTTTTTKHIILFNTGLHDIHRLCGSEYETEC